MSSKRNHQGRGKAFSIEEDIVLCNALLKIYQDPIYRVNQTNDKLWEHIKEVFDNHKPNNGRRIKSLACRMCTITKAMKKFLGCIRQVENMHQIGASELDILTKARVLFAQYPDEKKRFLFDHVWPILKEIEKLVDVIPKQKQRVRRVECFEASERYMSVPSLPGPTLSVDLNGDDEQVLTETPINSSRRPIEMKKEKARKRMKADKSQMLAQIYEVNNEILEIMKRGEQKNDEQYARMEKNSELRCQVMMLQAENERNKIQLEREKQDKEYMEKDLNSIMDPTEHEYFQGKKIYEPYNPYNRWKLHPPV